MLAELRRTLARTPATGPAAKNAPLHQTELCYGDSAPCGLYRWLDAGSDRFKSIGWLVKNHPYKRAKAEPARFQKLLAMLAEPWAPVHVAIRLECPFCPIVNPDHGKEKQPWWAMQRGHVDGVELIFLRTPEALCNLESFRLSRSGAPVGFNTSSLFVPGNGCVFVAHPMLAHFVDAHSYAPPAEFWNAIEKCPPVNSLAYLEALLANGPQNSLWAAALWAASVLRVPDRELDCFLQGASGSVRS